MTTPSPTDAPPGGWIEPYAGMAFRDRATSIDATAEHKALRQCGIDPALYGDTIDPATFVSHAIHEGVRNAVHAIGTVNMAQRIVQRGPLRLGEPITVSGRVLDVEVVPRGKVATTEVHFTPADSGRGAMAGRRSLRPDPARAGVRGAGEKVASVVEDPTALRIVDRVALTPAMVAGYDSEGINPIHSDPDAARAAGFRAPIIGGGMGVRWLTAAIWKRFPPLVLELEIYFRRPIFWDDSVSVRVAEHGATWTAICLEKDGKVATEARIHRLEA